MNSNSHLEQQLSFPELYPTDCRVFDPSEFYLAAEAMGLTFEFTPSIPAPTGTTDPSPAEPSFYAELDAKIHAHARAKQLSFPPNPSPSGTALVGSGAAQHARAFAAMDWVLIQLGAKPRSATNGRIISRSGIACHGFTVSNFRKLTSFPNPLATGNYHLIGVFTFLPCLKQV